MNESTPEGTEHWAGLFVVTAVLLLLAGFAFYIYHTAERKGWFVPRCPYFTFVQSAEGLRVGDRVRMMGFDVGEISVVEAQPPFSYYNVFIGIEIKRPYYGYILSDSKAKVITPGLLGRQLEITKGATGMPTVVDRNNRPAEILVDGRMVSLTEAPKGGFLWPDEAASLSERAERLLDQVELALPNIVGLTNRLNDVLDNANTLVTNSSALIVNLNDTVTQLQPVVSNATLITGNLTGPTAAVETQIATLVIGLNETLLNLAAMTGNLNAQVQSNENILSGISTLVTNSDDLVQGLKRHWLLRGVFRNTNVPAKRP